ncbi:MAG: hypothetical protein R3F11_31265 [Verrucomicrobiales bacterium]
MPLLRGGAPCLAAAPRWYERSISLNFSSGEPHTTLYEVTGTAGGGTVRVLAKSKQPERTRRARSAGSILDSDGNATPVSVSWEMPNTWNVASNGGTQDDLLMRGYGPHERGCDADDHVAKHRMPTRHPGLSQQLGRGRADHEACRSTAGRPGLDQGRSSDGFNGRWQEDGATQAEAAVGTGGNSAAARRERAASPCSPKEVRRLGAARSGPSDPDRRGHHRSRIAEDRDAPAQNIAPRSADLVSEVTQPGIEAPASTLYFGTSDAGAQAAGWAGSLDAGTQARSVRGATGRHRPNTSTARPRRTAQAKLVADRRLVHHAGRPMRQSPTKPPTTCWRRAPNSRATVTDTGGEPPAVTIYYGATDGGGTDPGAWAQSGARRAKRRGNGGGERIGAFGELQLPRLCPEQRRRVVGVGE